MNEKPNWKDFWTELRRLGSKALARVPQDLKGVVDATADDADGFWSQMLVDTFYFEWQQGEPEMAIYVTLREYAANVRSALQEYEDDGYKIDRIEETSRQNIIQRLVKAAQVTSGA